MRILFFVILLVTPFLLFSQKESSTWVRAFPITDYIVDLNDSTKVVQLHLEEGATVIEKQMGLLRGLYRDKHTDTATIGAGRCYLIKGEYYYFTINYKQSGIQPREGDLLYTKVDKPAVYSGQLLRLASFCIGINNVYEEKWYDRNAIFLKWSEQEERAALDSMVGDIHFTGNYFLQNSPSMNVKITGGRYDGKMVLSAMTNCVLKDITDFFEYILARPLLYAGHEWKIAEIFATWLSGGAPVVSR